MIAKNSMIAALLVILPVLFSSAQPQADIVIYNAQVYTVDAQQSTAQAVAIAKGKIVFVGSNEAAKALATSTTQLKDAKGQFLMPGFIEGHGHIHNLGDFLREINLMNVANWEEALLKIQAAVQKAKPGDWIVGRGWHQEKWNVKPSPNFLGYPFNDALNAIAPNNPVMLVHASGHSVYVNEKAFALAGISKSTPNPTGGAIVKDSTGKLVGVLEETAMTAVKIVYNQFLQQQSNEQRKTVWQQGMALAEKDCLRKGITSFVDAGSNFEQMQWMQTLAEQQKLNIRHWVMIRETPAVLLANANKLPVLDAGNGFLTVKAVKVSLDGALGSYGAWLLDPYTDRPDFYGQNTFPMDALQAIAAFCWNKNLQLCVHAIGDKANRKTIDIFETQIKQDPLRDHRWRVEHAQHVHPSEIPRFAQLHIIASMQGIHATSDGPFVPKRLGEKRSREGAYMWRAFLDAGVLVNNGTDVPVEDQDPIANFYATVTRKMKNGTAFYPAQSMTRQEALYATTMANAKAQFQENAIGSITVGKMADLVLLSNNLITCPETDIRSTKIVWTMVNGQIKFTNE